MVIVDLLNVTKSYDLICSFDILTVYLSTNISLPSNIIIPSFEEWVIAQLKGLLVNGM